MESLMHCSVNHSLKSVNIYETIVSAIKALGTKADFKRDTGILQQLYFSSRMH